MVSVAFCKLYCFVKSYFDYTVIQLGKAKLRIRLPRSNFEKLMCGGLLAALIAAYLYSRKVAGSKLERAAQIKVQNRWKKLRKFLIFAGMMPMACSNGSFKDISRIIAVMVTEYRNAGFLLDMVDDLISLNISDEVDEERKVAQCDRGHSDKCDCDQKQPLVFDRVVYDNSPTWGNCIGCEINPVNINRTNYCASCENGKNDALNYDEVKAPPPSPALVKIQELFNSGQYGKSGIGYKNLGSFFVVNRLWRAFNHHCCMFMGWIHYNIESFFEYCWCNKMKVFIGVTFMSIAFYSIWKYFSSPCKEVEGGKKKKVNHNANNKRRDVRHAKDQSSNREDHNISGIKNANDQNDVDIDRSVAGPWNDFQTEDSPVGRSVIDYIKNYYGDPQSDFTKKVYYPIRACDHKGNLLGYYVYNSQGEVIVAKEISSKCVKSEYRYGSDPPVPSGDVIFEKKSAAKKKKPTVKAEQVRSGFAICVKPKLYTIVMTDKTGLLSKVNAYVAREHIIVPRHGCSGAAKLCIIVDNKEYELSSQSYICKSMPDQLWFRKPVGCPKLTNNKFNYRPAKASENLTLHFLLNGNESYSTGKAGATTYLGKDKKILVQDYDSSSVSGSCGGVYVAESDGQIVGFHGIGSTNVSTKPQFYPVTLSWSEELTSLSNGKCDFSYQTDVDYSKNFESVINNNASTICLKA